MTDLLFPLFTGARNKRLQASEIAHHVVQLAKQSKRRFCVFVPPFDAMFACEHGTERYERVYRANPTWLAGVYTGKADPEQIVEDILAMKGNA